ncbi:tellurium resistance protein [Rhodococcus sp. HNM0563]|uniref:TerD family protein n=1 Tax=unclassified Rhodococcus (in: high G+C Gram-positive bacteria) TaxID=192944 RepID=UPI00146D41BC|nr:MULTISPECIES: tellurium resistance protein [unclassified Rhodococcus (in: high G+C Gram-positive bacteria)]MCK0091665.1 tellurium resistance protein [Rhodococcus sp. F64268]NLU63987.1 tellurium resistance protein [Rhodococcus sp. HNM0563]
MAIDYNKKPEQGSSGVNLSKINLTKESPTVSLSKGGAGQGVVRVNLNWSRGEQKKGFLAKLTGATGGVDLDLGCLYELADGSKGVIQALGNSFGALNSAPYIHLDGDDRTGSAQGGENMHINLERPELFKRVLIFAMIYEGAANWAAVDGVITLTQPSGQEIEVRLDSPNNGARICAIAMLQSTGQGVTVQRLVEYVNGSQSDLDRQYGWGMQWQAGRK